MVDRSQVRFETEELGVAGGIILCRRCTNSAYFFARNSATSQKKPFYERHLTKSGFGKPKAAKLDNPSDAVLRERGRGAVLGDEGKAVGMQSADGFAVCACHAHPPLPPPWSVEEQDACYVVG